MYVPLEGAGPGSPVYFSWHTYHRMECRRSFLWPCVCNKPYLISFVHLPGKTSQPQKFDYCAFPTRTRFLWHSQWERTTTGLLLQDYVGCVHVDDSWADTKAGKGLGQNGPSINLLCLFSDDLHGITIALAYFPFRELGGRRERGRGVGGGNVCIYTSPVSVGVAKNGVSILPTKRDISLGTDQWIVEPNQSSPLT